jgi:TetR/AcrR family transcriptional repressor of bet genes
MAVAAGKTGRRTASREARRQQLIEATINCIAKLGLGNTTLAKVAQEAGLSQGIVNLHFESKDNLLNETLRHLAQDYNAHFEKTLQKAGPDSATKLRAVMEMDLKPAVCDRKKLAVWFAFWGEVKSVPTYRKICQAYDSKFDDLLYNLADDIIRDGRYTGISAQQVTDALSSMTDGLWLSCLVSPGSWDRHAATDAVMSYLRGVFPQHYNQ